MLTLSIVQSDRHLRSEKLRLTRRELFGTLNYFCGPGPMQFEAAAYVRLVADKTDGGENKMRLGGILKRSKCGKGLALASEKWANRKMTVAKY